MKKATINRLLGSALIVFALTACTNETNENGFDNRTPITVTSSSIAASRATDNAWQAADAIGITLFESGTSNLVEGNPIVGKYITATGDGVFTAADKGNTLYFPTQNKKSDIVAFYPYTTIDASLTVPVNVADQSKLLAIDLMVADKVSGKSATDDEVALTFRHQLVKLELTVDCNESAEGVDISAATLALHGTPTTATWDLTTATLTAAASSVKAIDLPTIYDEEKKTLSSTAIILPCEVKDVKLAVTADDYAFDVPFTANMLLKAGTKNTLRVHLNRTEAIVETAIEDWTTGVTADLESLILTTAGTDGAADELTDNSTFSKIILWLADEVLTDFSTATSGAPLGASHSYTKGADGAWTSENPIYLDKMTANNVIYATASNTDADGNAINDAVTGLSDYLVAGPVTVQGGVAAVELRHGLAQMTMKLVAGDGFTLDIDGASITAPAMLKSAAMATDAEGVLHFAARGTETVNYTIADAEAHIVVPQTLAANSVFTVTLANGNVYEAKLAEAVTLSAGVNTTIILTLMPTQVGVNATVTPWGEAAVVEAAVQLAGITAGDVSVTAAEGDQLTITYALDNLTATYTYANSAWGSTAPLYWDDINKDNFNGNFAAEYVFATKTAPVEDKLVGTITNAAYGSALNFNLTHSTAKMTFTFKGDGTTTTDEEVAAFTKTITLGDAPHTITAEAMHFAPQALTDANTIVLTRPNGNTYTVKLTDLKDAQQATIFTDGIEAGQHYQITLTVSETSVGISATIAEWTDVSGSGTVTPDFQ